MEVKHIQQRFNLSRNYVSNCLRVLDPIGPGRTHPRRPSRLGVRGGDHAGRQAGGLGLTGQDADGVGPRDGRADLYLQLRRLPILRSGGAGRAYVRR